MNEPLNSVFKKASSRLKLLNRIRNNVTPLVAYSIYNMLIKPLMTYCSPILLRISRHHVEKFQTAVFYSFPRFSLAMLNQIYKFLPCAPCFIRNIHVEISNKSPIMQRLAIECEHLGFWQTKPFFHSKCYSPK